MNAAVKIILLATLLLGCIGLAAAQPPLPMTIYGYVHVDGELAPSGLDVYAKHGVDIVVQTTTDAGYYILSISYTSGLENGAPIDLWVEQHNITRITLAYFTVLEVNLTIPAAPPEPGYLSVDTSPVKGEVFVEGHSWGTAPQTRELSVGTYTVTFGDVTGYVKPEPVEATVLADQTTNVLGTYTLITWPDFTITVSPSSGSVVQGGVKTATVTITSIADYSQTVSLSASGQPTNVSVSFNPTSGTPTFTSTMTINVGENAVPGTYTITIMGAGADETTHTTTYRLTVTTPAPEEEEKPVGGTFGPVNRVYLALALAALLVAQNSLAVLAISMLIVGICIVVYQRRKK